MQATARIAGSECTTGEGAGVLPNAPGREILIDNVRNKTMHGSEERVQKTPRFTHGETARIADSECKSGEGAGALLNGRYTAVGGRDISMNKKQ